MLQIMQAIINAVMAYRTSRNIHVTTTTEPTMRKTNNPYLGRVMKITTYTNCQLGADYERMVQRRINNEGLDANFKAAKRKGCTWYNAWCDVSDRDPNTFYLKIGLTSTTKTKSIILLDGRTATADEEKIIRSFFTNKPQPAQTQLDAGVPLDRVVGWNTPKVCNVREIWLGNETCLYKRNE